MAMEVDFDPYKSEIEPQYYAGLHEVANFMNANPKVTATVEGHAGKSVGTGTHKVQLTAEQSMEISSRRAQKVVDYR
jgi:outer membrane protein OmpA-like peptidoglycan-associated protein